MNDFQEGPDIFNADSDNNRSAGAKKPNVFLDILMGVGISAITYFLGRLIPLTKFPSTIIALIYFILLGAFVFLTVKFFRTMHTAAAITMLVSVSPFIFSLLLIGACSIMFGF
ncbi:hypothetical protein [Acetivibrio cellulolyticus]|uniref:hypothetical protein n=1 Tax=Acetivibrio cellulolyticus TaxID=35830 RepID=UPI0001E2EC01|nr:hypothetical protein [Acetivibrio cellulolyticus]